MKRTIIASALMLSLIALTATGAIILTATPAAADITYYYTIALSGPSAGTVGQTLTFTATYQQCTDEQPSSGQGGPPAPLQTACGPAPNLPLTFDVEGPSHGISTTYASVTNTRGVATAAIPFAKPGVYVVAVYGPDRPNNRAVSVTITEDKQPATPAQPGGSSGSGSSGSSSSGGGDQALPGSGGGASPSPTATSNTTAAVLGLEQVSATAGSASGWMWILALGIIILLAIIVAVLLVTRRHPREEEYTPEDANDYYYKVRRRE